MSCTLFSGVATPETAMGNREGGALSIEVGSRLHPNTPTREQHSGNIRTTNTSFSNLTPSKAGITTHNPPRLRRSPTANFHKNRNAQK